jgi:iron complex outermembrane receptor protein
MKRKLIFLAFSSVLFADSAQLEKVSIEEEVNTITIKNVSAEQLKSADLADALSKNIPSISLIRRSGIANDIILRGQKRDNINIIIDGAKICGACVNRMDPPTSHVVTHVVDSVQINEGPFDVENFGTLSGVVNIYTKEPRNGFHGEIGVNVGSFGYQKVSTTLSGGNDDIKALITISKEKGEQYEDGDGNTLADQLEKWTNNTPSKGAQYQPNYKDMDAFEKTTIMAKFFAHITDDQDLKVSFTANRSDDVLYPSSKMDAIWDDSDIFNIEYQIRNISSLSKTLDFQFYNSTVDHPMSIRYRKKAVVINPMNNKPYGDMTNHLTTKMQGFKLKNGFDLSNTNIIVGLDTSTRNWDGKYYVSVGGKVMKFPMGSSKGKEKYSINDGETINNAIFVKTKNKINKLDLDFGIRYDDTTVENGGGYKNRDFSDVSANVFATYNLNDSMRYFIGVGKSSRVPDVRELYFMSSSASSADILIGNPSLDQTQNYEIDLGFEKVFDSFSLKTKLFYSMLKDYIAFNASNKKAKMDGTKEPYHSFENVDATIYGIEVSGLYMATDEIYLDYGLSYKRGEKDNPLKGQTDTDLAEITPMKANIGIGYDYDDSLSAKLDAVVVGDWEDYDSDNGEQAIDGYSVFNFKVQKEFESGFALTLGVDNILDETYTTTNTYRDLTLITTGKLVDDVMLLNEPGRYFYLNGSYKF